MMMNKKEQKFVEIVWKHYGEQGRHDLPWRKTSEPYKILVSEVMLQQTQVARVLPKYKEFLKLFPTTKKLAEASLGDVLKAWQGLGYNRRAKFLKQAAEALISEHQGKWPTTVKELRALPGVGTYTAGAIMNFAYNKPVPLIETNVRTVYLHHFFKDKTGVSDNELLPIIEQTLDHSRPRAWHWALMDYGSHLKATVGNVNIQSKTYIKQSDFKTSNRYIRGAIIRELSKHPHSLKNLKKILIDIDQHKIEQQIKVLQDEDLILEKGARYLLP